MAKIKTLAVRKPRILITAEDLAILESLIGGSTARAAAVNLLEDELTRAVVVGDSFTTRQFCRIGSWVTYEDLGSGQIRNIQLVLPGDADIDKRQVSVLSLVGASLLGLAENAEFGWSDDSGRPHRLKVLSIGADHHAALE